MQIQRASDEPGQIIVRRLYENLDWNLVIYQERTCRLMATVSLTLTPDGGHDDDGEHHL
jgi:hypothetical protein